MLVELVYLEAVVVAYITPQRELGFTLAVLVGLVLLAAAVGLV